MAKVRSYSVPDQEVKGFEKLLFELGKVDRWSDSKIILEAVKEYAHRHLPGNPQLVLPNYIPELNTPFSDSAKEKLKKPTNAETCQTCAGYGWIQHD